MKKRSFYPLHKISARTARFPHAVEKLCMNGEKAVRKLTLQIFLRPKGQTIPSGPDVHGIFAPRFA